MIILMKSDKSLVISKFSKLRQRDNAVDQLKFYIPQSYNDIDLSNFIVTLNYMNPGNVARSEVLDNIDSEKENFLCFQLPVTTKFTEMAGDIELNLSMTYQDASTSTSYVLHSGELTVTVDSWADFYAFTSSDSFLALDTKMLQIQNEIAKLKSIEETYAESQVTDLAFDDDEKLRLKAGENLIGDGVDVLTPTQKDNIDDNPNDGVIDLETATTTPSDSDDDSSTTPTFIEL